MTTDEEWWEWLYQPYVLAMTVKSGIDDMHAQFPNILAAVRRETVEACAAVADRWLTVQGEIGPLQTLGIHNAAEGIGREILALIPKGDGRCQ